jgi:GDP-L-fucose synthase
MMQSQAEQTPVLSKQHHIFVAGHRGMVGSAIVRHLKAHGYERLLTFSHEQLDLRDQQAVRRFFAEHEVDHVVLAAAKVGGILANSTYPAAFIYDNLMIEANVVNEAFRAGVNHLLFLGSSCIYPKFAPQPMREEHLLAGYLEPTNEPYAIAKIAGIKLCEAYNREHGMRYRCLMPTNLYGPNDNYDLNHSHVLPALIRKFHLAKLALQGDWEAIARDQQRYGTIPADIRASLAALAKQAGCAVPAELQDAGLPVAAVRLWGSGSPKREFLYVDDLAAACLFCMQLPDEQWAQQCRVPADEKGQALPGGPLQVAHLNVGSGTDLTIKALAANVQQVVGYTGDVVWDTTKPDGTPRKLMDVSKLKALGWQPAVSLQQGIGLAYEDYLQKIDGSD